MTPPTLRVRIGRLVLDGRVAAGSQESIGEAIQTELASLLSDRGAAEDAHGHGRSSLAGSIAARIAGRLDAMSVRSPSAARRPSPSQPPSPSLSPTASADAAHRGPHG